MQTRRRNVLWEVDMRIIIQSFRDWIARKAKARLIKKQEACSHEKRRFTLIGNWEYCLKCGVSINYGVPIGYGSDERPNGWYNPVLFYHAIRTYLRNMKTRRILRAKEKFVAWQQSCNHSWREHHDHNGNPMSDSHTCVKCGVPRYGNVYYYGQDGRY
jgi:hypothetical protein